MLSKISRNLSIVFLLVIGLSSAYAQELKATVTVVPKPNMNLTTVDREVIDVLQRVVEEFVNNTKWTEDVFEITERINCSFQLTINSIPSTGVYNASLIINANRPIFNASISSTMINFLDENVNFAFQRDQIMQYSDNQFRDNLTSIFAFWVYMILGYDYDSFSIEGGTKFFLKAQQIASLAQGSGGGGGWSQNDASKRNRFFIIDNHLNPLYQPLRAAYYNYHRKGLDLLFNDIEGARKNIIESLKTLEAIQNARFGNVNLQIFTLAKRDELVKIFSKAEAGEKTDAVAVLKKIDPSNGEKYDEILKM
jgi:hypothetical protein